MSNVIEGVQLGAQTTVNAEELLVHNSSQRQATEGVHTSLIEGLGVFVSAFELESEVIGQMTAFVVSSKEPERLGIVNLEGPEVEDTFDTEVTTVDVIAQEQVSSLGGITSNLEELHQVVILAVDVTAHGNGGIHLEEVGLGS